MSHDYNFVNFKKGQNITDLLDKDKMASVEAHPGSHGEYFFPSLSKPKFETDSLLLFKGNEFVAFLDYDISNFHGEKSLFSYMIRTVNKDFRVHFKSHFKDWSISRELLAKALEINKIRHFYRSGEVSSDSGKIFHDTLSKNHIDEHKEYSAELPKKVRARFPNFKEIMHRVRLKKSFRSRVK